MSAAEDLFWMEADDGYERIRHEPTDDEVAEMMANLKAAVAEAKTNYRHNPVKQRGVYFPPVRELSLEQLAEQAAIDADEAAGGPWTRAWAAKAAAENGLVPETHYRSAPGLDPRRGMRRD